jgi:KUP system potassium uptake protein
MLLEGVRDASAARISPLSNPRLFMGLVLRSLGVVYGDIGTSPLYVYNTVFGGPPTEQQVIGAASLILWSLIIIVTLKYAIFIIIADNHGEGGTFALASLLTGPRSKLSRFSKKLVAVASILGAALILGDGAITPAVSVLGAIEGVAVYAPSLTNWVVRITVIILVCTFVVQRFGTSKIGMMFGPVIVVWFSVLFIVGMWRITQHPVILRAFNPFEALHYFAVQKSTAFNQLGGVFLAVTGVETMYADIGHFGAWAVRCGWLFGAMPALMVIYLGQGALLIGNPALINNPFYNSVPHWMHWPMLALATMATIIASEAVIAGSFSLLSQAISLGYAPPLAIEHKSKTIIGQIYVPSINWLLMILSIIVTVGFQTSTFINNAYGVTISSVLMLTTVLYMITMRKVWYLNYCLVFAFLSFFVVDALYFAANLNKVPQGGMYKKEQTARFIHCISLP